MDKIRLRINQNYDEMFKDEGFVTAQKLKISFLGIGVMADTILTVFADHNGDFKKMVDKEQRSASTYAKYDIVYRDRKSVVSGKSVSVRVDLGGGRSIKKKKTT